MVKKVCPDGEFSGGPGMIQKRNIRNRHLDGVEEVWAVYATDPESTDEPDPNRVGDPASYTPSAAARSRTVGYASVQGRVRRR